MIFRNFWKIGEKWVHRSCWKLHPTASFFIPSVPPNLSRPSSDPRGVPWKVWWRYLSQRPKITVHHNWVKFHPSFQPLRGGGGAPTPSRPSSEPRGVLWKVWWRYLSQRPKIRVHRNWVKFHPSPSFPTPHLGGADPRSRSSGPGGVPWKIW